MFKNRSKIIMLKLMHDAKELEALQKLLDDPDIQKMLDNDAK